MCSRELFFFNLLKKFNWFYIDCNKYCDLIAQDPEELPIVKFS